MVFEIVRYSERPRAALPVRGSIGVVRLNSLQPYLNFANRIEILVHSSAIGRSESTLQPLHGPGDGIQNAPVFSSLRNPLLHVFSLAEETLEYQTRVILHGQRRGR